MEKKCKYCAMMIPKEAKFCPHCRKRQGMSVGFKLLLGLILFSALMAAISLLWNSGKNASDDVVYTEVTRCMDLQYSLRPDWKPSDTYKSASCISNATARYGEERIKEMIGLWLAKPRSINYMTLLDEEVITLCNEALAVGGGRIDLRELLISSVLTETAKRAKMGH
jgi:hypothetical protein